MIAHLSGSIDTIEKDTLVIDVGGVGYSLLIPSTSMSKLSVGQRVKIFTHTLLRQDSLELFGFLTRGERELFRLLLKVSGIGPRTALCVLSAMEPWELAKALLEGDAERLQKVHNVGKKTAQRIIVELKDHDALLEYLNAGDGSCAKGIAADVVQALESLGCDRGSAKEAVRRAIERLGANAPSQRLLESSLAILGSGS